MQGSEWGLQVGWRHNVSWGLCFHLRVSIAAASTSLKPDVGCFRLCEVAVLQNSSSVAQQLCEMWFSRSLHLLFRTPQLPRSFVFEHLSMLVCWTGCIVSLSFLIVFPNCFWKAWSWLGGVHVLYGTAGLEVSPSPCFFWWYQFHIISKGKWVQVRQMCFTVDFPWAMQIWSVTLSFIQDVGLHRECTELHEQSSGYAGKARKF